MRKVLRVRFAFLILSVFSAVAGYPWDIAAQSCESPVAKIVSVQGSVEVRSGESAQWQPVDLYDTFCPGDTIRVLGNSRADITLMDRSFLRINENTTIVLEGVLEERTSLIDLLKGAAHFLSRDPRSLEIKTNFAIFGVRGTEFFIRVDDDQAFMSVFAGAVLAENAIGSLTLTGGQSAVTRAGMAPVLSVVARPRDAVRWALYYPPVMYDIPSDIIERKPDTISDPQVLAQRAALLLNVGRVREASADLDRTMELKPDFSDALALQSIIAIVQNDKDKALTLARQAVAVDPGSATAWIALSYANQASFDLDGARTALEEAVNAKPDNALAWARLADIQASFGDLENALESAKKAESLAPDLALTQTVLGFAFLIQTRIDEAKAAFEKAIILDQAAPLPRLGLGLAKIREGDLEAGGREMEIAASLDPNNSIIRSYLGKTYYEEKRMPLDEREYRIAKELDPNDPTPWFYDAISKQTTNRPVEALHDLQKAIELNDNRFVYRSKLLLDSDLAARQSSLARIYNDLGFGQRALVEGWQALNTDPTNFSAHRFLADSYAVLPRREIARVSELLQSQLLQPINTTPIQPSLAESDLFLINSQGPDRPSFNEFNNPIFTRNIATAQLNGVAGENSTWAGEGIVSGIYDNLSLSAGYSHFETDGFRINNDQQDDIANVFGQYELTHKTSFQAEYRQRDTERGETQLRFFADDVDPTLRQEDEINSIRAGFRQAYSPDSILIGNFTYQDGEFTSRTQTDTPIVSSREFVSDKNAYGAELEYFFRSEYVNGVGGVGYFDVDSEDKRTEVEIIPGFPIPFPPFFVDPVTQIDRSESDRDVDHSNLYLYTYISALKNLTFTVGASGDLFNSGSQDQEDVDQLNPKLGISWSPFQDTTLRFAAFRVLKRTLITNQTLEPTQVAGFNQFYDDITAVDAWNYGAAIDQKLSRSLFGGMEYIYRDLNVPFTIFPSPDVRELTEADWKEERARAYLFWTPHQWLSLTAEWQWEKLERERFTLGAKDVKTNFFPLGVNVYHPSGFYAGLKGTYVNQKGSFERRFQAGVFEDGKDNFWLVDAAVGYRLPKRYGLVSIGVTNLFDEDFQYFETDAENPRIQPERSVFVRFTLAFP